MFRNRVGTSNKGISKWGYTSNFMRGHTPITGYLTDELLEKVISKKRLLHLTKSEAVIAALTEWVKK